MSDSPTPELENKLRELTEWRGPKTTLWKDALLAAHGPKRAPVIRLWRWLPAVGIIGAAAVLVMSIALPSLHGAREQGKRATDWRWDVPSDTTAAPSENNFSLHFADQDNDGAVAVTGDAVHRGAFRGRVELETPDSVGPPAPPASPLATAARPVGEMQKAVGGASSAGGAGGAAADAGERYVVRKATIELASDDVRATFTKASHLVSEAHGEFIQDSSMTGDSNQLQANLTLRVAAERLSEVLNALRDLGKVRSESAGGEDVTTQVVDIEARLRNERRVEAELLELLEKRTDAPLKEVLELRQSLNNVRGSIEQMTAQRERLGRLVSLATIVVIIRAADAPPATQPGLGTYLNRSLHRALHESGRFVADSLAVLVNVVFGGIVWWVLLVVTIVVVRAYVRSTRRTQHAATQ